MFKLKFNETLNLDYLKWSDSKAYEESHCKIQVSNGDFPFFVFDI